MSAVMAQTEQSRFPGRTLVVGLGKTGLSCVRHLQNLGVQFAVADSREQPPGLDQLHEHCPDVPVFLGDFDESLFTSVDRLVVSPGVSLREPAIQAAITKGLDVLGDIDLFALQANAPVIAITGSNGKSSVTTLVGNMAAYDRKKVRVGGNLGTPALEMLDDKAELYVLELSSFQLETTKLLKPEVAVVLNISPDHMDRYDSLADYAAAKARIYAQAKHCVVNRDDPQVMAMVDEADYSFGLSAASKAGQYCLIEHDKVRYLGVNGLRTLSLEQLHTPGLHNAANALAAMAIAEAAGISELGRLKAVMAFKGLEHRMQWVGEANDVRWYNDSKATNVGATIAAVQGLGCPVVLIAGGDGKGADFSELAPVLADSARAVVLIGRDGPKIEAVLEADTQRVTAIDMADAVRKAQQLAQAGDAVLLAPACASFDMFKSFEHRGDVFTSAVQEVLA